MAQATQDLVIRMKTDSKNFNDGIDKAKGKIKSFGSDGSKAMGGFTTAIGTASKAFAALGLAVGAKDLFMSFINSTESMSDTFNNEIGAMKDGWKDFLWQVNTANFSGFDNLITKARKAREELDALGDASALFDLSTSKLSTDMEDLLNTIQKKKKKGEDYSGEVEQYNQLLKEYKKSGQLKQDKTVSSLQALFDRKGFNLGDMGLGGKGVDGYLELAMTAREAAAGVYDDVIKQYREARDKTATGDLKEEGDWVYSEPHDYLGELQKEKGFAWVQRAKILSDLADITTEEKNQIDALLKDYYATDRAIIQQDRKLNRYLETETSKGGGGGGGTSTKRGMTFEQELEYLHNGIKNEILNDDRIKDSLVIEIEIQDEEIEEPETDALIKKYQDRIEAWQKQMNTLNQYAQTIGYLTNVFGALSSIINDDSPWKKFVNVLGAVVGGIENVITAYASLTAAAIAAEAMKAGESLPFPFNIALIAAAGASLISVIAAIKASAKTQKFANGGIVGGHDYNDGIHANLSSGEMVINRQQQLKLWNIIQGMPMINPALMGIKFIIEGEQLVGVIDNYNKNLNY